MHIDGAQSDQLFSVVLRQITINDGDQVAQLSYLLVVLGLGAEIRTISFGTGKSARVIQQSFKQAVTTVNYYL